MADAVCFLVSSGELVLFDDVADIIIDRGSAYDARLAPAVNNLTVDVEARLFVLLAHSVLFKLMKVFACLKVYCLIIKISVLGKVNLCLIYVQK